MVPTAPYGVPESNVSSALTERRLCLVLMRSQTPQMRARWRWSAGQVPVGVVPALLLVLGVGEVARR